MRFSAPGPAICSAFSLDLTNVFHIVAFNILKRCKYFPPVRGTCSRKNDHRVRTSSVSRAGKGKCAGTLSLDRPLAWLQQRSTFGSRYVASDGATVGFPQPLSALARQKIQFLVRQQRLNSWEYFGRFALRAGPVPNELGDLQALTYANLTSNNLIGESRFSQFGRLSSHFYQTFHHGERTGIGYDTERLLEKRDEDVKSHTLRSYHLQGVGCTVPILIRWRGRARTASSGCRRICKSCSYCAVNLLCYGQGVCPVGEHNRLSLRDAARGPLFKPAGMNNRTTTGSLSFQHVWSARWLVKRPNGRPFCPI